MQSISGFTGNYIENLGVRKQQSKELGLQSTRHQQDAIDTAELFDDTSKRSIGIFMSLFKRYTLRRYDLLQLRSWVMGLPDCDNRGRLFVSVVRKKL